MAGLFIKFQGMNFSYSYICIFQFKAIHLFDYVTPHGYQISTHIKIQTCHFDHHKAVTMTKASLKIHPNHTDTGTVYGCTLVILATPCMHCKKVKLANRESKSSRLQQSQLNILYMNADNSDLQSWTHASSVHSSVKHIRHI